MSRLLPGGLAEKLRADPEAGRRTERLTVTVLMSDVRGYSAIAEPTDPTVLAGQLNEHRREMNTAILDLGGTVMQYVGDAVMAVFGAPFPQPDHAERALRAACAMHRRQELVERTLGGRWAVGVRTRDRCLDRRRRGSPARQRRAPRVHGGRRHREPRPAPAGSGPPRRHDGAQRGDQARCR